MNENKSSVYTNTVHSKRKKKKNLKIIVTTKQLFKCVYFNIYTFTYLLIFVNKNISVPTQLIQFYFSYKMAFVLSRTVNLT